MKNDPLSILQIMREDRKSIQQPKDAKLSEMSSAMKDIVWCLDGQVIHGHHEGLL